MILGAVLAGGQSTRFGSDKALAELDGSTLLTRAVDLLAGWCEHVVVVGREDAPAPTLPDWPRAGMGPLGGIAAALGPGDTPEEHEVDTLVAGAGACDLDAVRALVREGPAAKASIRCARWPSGWAQGPCTWTANLLTSTRPQTLQHCKARRGRTTMGYERQADFGTPEVRSDTSVSTCTSR